jgi:hypothetical protein
MFSQEFPYRSGLLSTLAFSGAHNQLCTICAKFQISSIAEERSPEDLWIPNYSRHVISQEYQDTIPDFPKMKQRAEKGCVFCTFIIDSVCIEGRREGFRGRVGDVVKVTLNASSDQGDYWRDKPSLSIYRYQMPHMIKVRVVQCDERWAWDPLEYMIAVQISNRM